MTTAIMTTGIMSVGESIHHALSESMRVRDATPELEVRIGSVGRKTDSNLAAYAPGVSSSAYYSIRQYIISTGRYTRSRVEESEVYAYKSGLREIHRPGGVVFEMKQRVSTRDHLGDTYAVRVSLSSERRATDSEIRSSTDRAADKPIKRSRVRETFVSKDGTHVVDMSIIDKTKYEVEIEFVRNEDVYIHSVFEIIKYLSSARHALLMLLKSPDVKFNNAVNMKRRHFADLGDFIATPKWDAVRYMMIVRKDGTSVLINRTSEQEYISGIKTSLAGTVFDGEFFADTKKYIAFDILILKNRDLRLKSRSERMFILEETINKYAINVDIAESVIGSREPLEFMKYVDNPMLDGVVFAPRTSEYYNRQTLKYKPVHLLTIDFEVRIAGNNHGYLTYELFVLDKTKKGAIVPFEKYPRLMKVTPEGRELISTHKIIEFSWRNDTFVPLRPRYDKTTPNELQVANDIWEDINNPITEDEMYNALKNVCSRDGETYMQTVPFNTVEIPGLGIVCSMDSAEHSIIRCVLYAMMGNKYKNLSKDERTKLVGKYKSRASVYGMSRVFGVQIRVLDYFTREEIHRVDPLIPETSSKKEIDSITLLYKPLGEYILVGYARQVAGMSVIVRKSSVKTDTLILSARK